MRTLYRYELKKILSQKVLWIALLIMTALIVAQGIAGQMTGDAARFRKAEEISGREVNQELISEIQDGNKLDEYPTIKNIWIQCLQKDDFTGIDEQTLYASRLENNQKQMDAYQMTDGEKAYWEKKEADVQKPFVYQRDEGYSSLFSTVYFVNFLMLLLIGISVTGIFADEKSRGTDQLIFCSINKHKIFGAKMLAAVTVGTGIAVLFFGLAFLLGGLVYGTGGSDTQIQISVAGCMLPITIGQAAKIMVVVMLLSMLNIPENIRSISQAWRYMPGAFLGSWTFTDYRLTRIFGHYLNILQMAPIVWGLAAACALLIARLSYDRYQIKGR